MEAETNGALRRSGGGRTDLAADVTNKEVCKPSYLLVLVGAPALHPDFMYVIDPQARISRSVMMGRVLIERD
jgi:hypothetical protein